MWDRRWDDHHDVPFDWDHVQEIMRRPDDPTKFFQQAVPDLEPNVTHLNEGFSDLKKQL